MDSDLGVIVGLGIGGQDGIYRTLLDHGINATKLSHVCHAWPRDHYVYFNGRYVKSDFPACLSSRSFGEGGFILLGDDFLLVSDMVCVNTDIYDSLPNIPTYDQIKEAIVAEGRKHFPGIRIHVVPSGCFHDRSGCVNIPSDVRLYSDQKYQHIDIFSLLVPERKLLLLDTFYWESAALTREYDAVAEQEGLRLIRYDSSQDDVRIPLNSLVIPGGKVFVNSKARSLIRLLNGEDLEVIGVEMPPQIADPTGGIRCQTNLHDVRDDPLEYLSDEY